MNHNLIVLRNTKKIHHIGIQTRDIVSVIGFTAPLRLKQIIRLSDSEIEKGVELQAGSCL